MPIHSEKHAVGTLMPIHSEKHAVGTLMPIHSEKHAARHPRHRPLSMQQRKVFILHTFHCDWHVVPLTKINRICSHLCVRERCEASWVYGRHAPARTPSQQDSTRFSLSHRFCVCQRQCREVSTFCLGGLAARPKHTDGVLLLPCVAAGVGNTRASLRGGICVSVSDSIHRSIVQC
jgi:hypothetical protein